MSSKGKAPAIVAATTGNTSEEIGTPSKTMVTDSAAERAVKRMAQARLWVESNTSAWEAMTHIALGRTKSKAKFGMQELVETIRRKSYTDRHGMQTVINNSIVPALARILVDEHPECLPYVEFRTHAYDGL